LKLAKLLGYGKLNAIAGWRDGDGLMAPFVSAVFVDAASIMVGWATAPISLRITYC
jgi:hypothetical protein